jgi:hypothetical protein
VSEYNLKKCIIKNLTLRKQFKMLEIKRNNESKQYMKNGYKHQLGVSREQYKMEKTGRNNKSKHNWIGWLLFICGAPLTS